MATVTKRFQRRKLASLMLIVGIAMMLLAPATAASATPPTAECGDDGGYAKYNSNGDFVEGTDVITFTSFDSEAWEFDWTSSEWIDRVYVKGGQAGNATVDYDPAVKAGAFPEDFAGTVPSANAISHVTFCFGSPPSTTTTVPETTTTTVPETTTTTVPETTTTTVPETTTTTEQVLGTTTIRETTTTTTDPETTTTTEEVLGTTVERDETLAAAGLPLRSWLLAVGLTLGLGGLLLLLGDKERRIA